MPKPDAQDDSLPEYRKILVAAEQKSQEDFDKTVLALSGGALGISFTFLKDVIGAHPLAQPHLLFAAWVAWAFSTFAVLASYHLSHLALRKAIRQVDEGFIRKQRAGGAFASWTARLNEVGAILFLVGVLCLTTFAGFNFKMRGEENGKPAPPQANTAPARASAGTHP